MPSPPPTGIVDERAAHKSRPEEVLFTEYALADRAADESQRAGSPYECVLTLAPGWAHRAEWAARSSPEVAYAEALRQAVIVFAHLAHGVPPGEAFLMERMVFEVLGADTGRSTRVGLRTAEAEHRGGRLLSLVAEFSFEESGRAMLVGRGHLRVIPQPVYRRMRRGSGSSERLPRRRELPAGFALGPLDGTGRAVLEYDPAHPLYFDHAIDHVPGMLLVSAAIALFSERHPGHALASLDATFSAYLELDDDCAVPLAARAVDAGSAGLLRVEFPCARGAAATVDVRGAGYSAVLSDAEETS